MERYFENDPFARVLRAFAVLFPGRPFRCEWGEGLTDVVGDEVYGTTDFFDDGRIPIITIDCNLRVKDAVEVLAHELAHVAAGIGAGHGSAWEAAFELIHKEYCEIKLKKGR